MSTTLDHPMHWVADFDAARAAYRQAGISLFDTPFPPAPGARSATWWDGRGYLEVLDLVDRAQTRSSSSYGALPTTILPAVEQALDDGGGVVNFVVDVDDAEAAAARMRTNGIEADTTTVTLGRWPRTITLRFAWPVHGPPWRPLLLHYSLPWWARRAAERLRRGRPPRLRLDHLVVETPDPRASAEWLGNVLDRPAERARAEVVLGPRRVVFCPGTADRVTTVRLRGPGAPAATIAGLRLEPAADEHASR